MYTSKDDLTPLLDRGKIKKKKKKEKNISKKRKKYECMLSNVSLCHYTNVHSQRSAHSNVGQTECVSDLACFIR